MTTTQLPSYGIWTTDADGNRVMGFTPEQFLSVWQSRADLGAEVQRLREALELALEYWKHRQQRYKNRSPVWVEAARTALKETP